MDILVLKLFEEAVFIFIEGPFMLIFVLILHISFVIQFVCCNELFVVLATE